MLTTGNPLLESKDIDVNEHEKLPNITLKTQIRLESMDIDVNEHERLPNITLKTQIRLESKDKDVNKMNCELMLTYDTPLFGKQEVGI